MTNDNLQFTIVESGAIIDFCLKCAIQRPD